MTTPSGLGSRYGKVLKVLLVEDDPADAFLLRTMLEEAKGSTFSPTVAGSLAEALAWLSANSCQAVVLDLSLPDSRGLGTFHQLMSRWRYKQ